MPPSWESSEAYSLIVAKTAVLRGLAIVYSKVFLIQSFTNKCFKISITIGSLEHSSLAQEPKLHEMLLELLLGPHHEGWAAGVSKTSIFGMVGISSGHRELFAVSSAPPAVAKMLQMLHVYIST